MILKKFKNVLKNKDNLLVQRIRYLHQFVFVEILGGFDSISDKGITRYINTYLVQSTLVIVDLPISGKMSSAMKNPL